MFSEHQATQKILDLVTGNTFIRTDKVSELVDEVLWLGWTFWMTHVKWIHPSGAAAVKGKEEGDQPESEAGKENAGTYLIIQIELELG
jgi:hypothetical protein